MKPSQKASEAFGLCIIHDFFLLRKKQLGFMEFWHELLNTLLVDTKLNIFITTYV